MTKYYLYRHFLAKCACFAFFLFFYNHALYAKSTKSWHILLYGDAGFGSHGQLTVGEAMSLRHSNSPYDFAVSMGDNQYVDGNQVYYSIFEKPYQSLIDTGVVFYQTIGNHDLENDRLQMQLAYSEKVGALDNKTGGFALPAENYLISKTNLTWVVLNVSHPRNNIEIPDSTVAFAKKHLCDPKRQKDSDKWMVVSMHYPMWSTGPRGDNLALQQVFLDLFQQCPPDFLLTGHEHHLEHLNPWKWMQFAIVGSSGSVRKGRSASSQESLFFLDDLGFAELSLQPQLAQLTFLDKYGFIRHQVDIQKRPLFWADTWFKDQGKVYGRVGVGYAGDKPADFENIEAQVGFSQVAVSPLISLNTWTFGPAEEDFSHFSFDEHRVFAANIPPAAYGSYAIFRFRVGNGPWIYGDMGLNHYHGNYDGISSKNLLPLW